MKRNWSTKEWKSQKPTPMSSIQQKELKHLDLLKMLGKKVVNSPKWWWKMVIYWWYKSVKHPHQTKTNPKSKSKRMIPNVVVCRCLFPTAFLGETSSWKKKLRWKMDEPSRERFFTGVLKDINHGTIAWRIHGNCIFSLYTWLVEYYKKCW